MCDAPASNTVSSKLIKFVLPLPFVLMALQSFRLVHRLSFACSRGISIAEECFSLKAAFLFLHFYSPFLEVNQDRNFVEVWWSRLD